MVSWVLDDGSSISKKSHGLQSFSLAFFGMPILTDEQWSLLSSRTFLPMPIRLSNIILVASLGLYMAIVAFNNIFDYGSNFAFVSHVLSMDTTFPDNQGMWRSISGNGVHHFAYVMIILTEAVIATLCFWGAGRMWRKRKETSSPFQTAKGVAIYGLVLGIVLWYVGFVAIGGEWFLMWQSEIWNGTEVAMRNAMMFGLVLLYVSRKEV